MGMFLLIAKAAFRAFAALFWNGLSRRGLSWQWWPVLWLFLSRSCFPFHLPVAWRSGDFFCLRSKTLVFIHNLSKFPVRLLLPFCSWLLLSNRQRSYNILIFQVIQIERIWKIGMSSSEPNMEPWEPTSHTTKCCGSFHNLDKLLYRRGRIKSASVGLHQCLGCTVLLQKVLLEFSESSWEICKEVLTPPFWTYSTS